MTRPGVARLQGNSPFEVLSVGDDGLGVDQEPPLARGHLRVPGAQVARYRERHLRSPLEAWRQAGPEAFEQGEVASIADRIASRERAHSQVQTDDSAAGRDELDRGVAGISDFEPSHLRVRDAEHGTDCPEAQSGSDPRVPKVAPDAGERLARPAASAIRGSFTRCHGRVVWRASLISRLRAGGDCRRFAGWSGLPAVQATPGPAVSAPCAPLRCSMGRREDHSAAESSFLRRMERWQPQAGPRDAISRR